MNTNGRNNTSLCEKSMKMVTNMVKLSSFSIAKISLGTTASPPVTKRPGIADNNPAQLQFPRSLRSQEPKLVSYLNHPVEGDDVLKRIHEEKNVDAKASDYIRKVHDKNRNVGLDDQTAKLSAYIMPPPPHVVI